MSVIQHKSQRVAILIDTQNLYHSAKNLYNARVNFQQVLSDSLGDRTLIRAIAYLISTESGEEDGFFDALLSMGIETKTKDLLIYSSGNKKADWDIGITVDAIRIANKVDTIVLVTGDGDFVPLVDHLKSLGIQTEVVSFGKSASSKLIESSEAFLDLCIDYDKYLLSYNKNNNKNNNSNNNKNNNNKKISKYNNIENQKPKIKNNRPKTLKSNIVNNITKQSLQLNNIENRDTKEEEGKYIKIIDGINSDKNIKKVLARRKYNKKQL
jgi:uncharacterized LabA/DUF88 family protein